MRSGKVREREHEREGERERAVEGEEDILAGEGHRIKSAEGGFGRVVRKDIWEIYG